MTNSKAMYRSNLPQLGEKLFLTDGGLETTLIFLDGIDLPEFAAFTMLKDRKGVARLKSYYQTYVDLANANGTGFIAESPTWRASRDWGAKLGYSDAALAEANREAVTLVADLRTSDGEHPYVISGNMGPRGDGYVVGEQMTPEEAKTYHAWQIGIFAKTEADLVSAITMTYAEEAIGVALAAKEAGMPVVLSFTVETDGRLPTGQALHEAIRQVDKATESYPAYYMINCAHPTHFDRELKEARPEWSRILGIRANASRCSHAELDEAEELDAGNPVEFGDEHLELMGILPKLTVLGGCCGTDDRHIAEIAKKCV